MNTSIKSRSLATFCALSIVIVLSSCSKKPDETAVAPSPATSSTAMALSPAASSTAMAPAPKAASSTTDAMAPQAKPTLPAEAVKLGAKPTNETTCPASAPVKGKVTKKRGDIYHVSKEPDYAKVKPEICFKDTATAEKAGFRAPK